MFTLDPVIEAVQQGKKTFVSTFITNDKIAKAMNEYVDSQTVYTKEASKAITTMVSSVTSETLKAMQEYTKFDYTKFGEGIMKAWYNQGAKK
ncbi:MAG: hypothetical protein RLZZ196_703 [Bacteroidota bacterium]|jgi:translation elongation factor EF-Ts